MSEIICCCEKNENRVILQDKIALNITTEQGKTLKDAHGDVFRGLGQCSLLVLCRYF